MNYAMTRQYMLNKPEAVEDYPFGPQAAVFKVKGKIFAIMSEREGETQLNLKCDPDEALALRDIFESVKPGYHMNKKHWNTLVLEKEIPSGEVQRMIDRSYGLVVKGLRRSVRLSFELAYGADVLYQ